MPSRPYNGTITQPNHTREIRRRLLGWYARERRDLAWRRTKNPYRIWVSEIMLQQTRVAAAEPYYRRFILRFPNVAALAAASEDEVLTAWSGLGYYSRARNLLRAARTVAVAGRFPRDYDSIRALPGVGDYTAAAIASIAFGLPHAAVDGNVMRVLARLVGERGDIGSTQVRRRLVEAAGRLLDTKRPGEFNQAMMELGATVCVPREPQCDRCPICRYCEARERGIEREVPVKLRRVPTVCVEKTLLLVRKHGRVLLRRREAGAAQMAGFWELPDVKLLPQAVLGERVLVLSHTITRHRYRVSVVIATLQQVPNGFSLVRLDEFDSIPMSTETRKVLLVLEHVRERAGD